ncbi:hypothetical protein INS49_005928 [Diaporthe citri]|uniref:uncharacterized protein n=1 Tax=Diaporthe citri TaxID=83186 RepID=UPI001C812FBC|nr:uncharacterized protein INS49_005928 [Diaporthe citri]KAG6364327.1 hypothetical protein INS49_005928 [Diaporthe citri]
MPLDVVLSYFHQIISAYAGDRALQAIFSNPGPMERSEATYHSPIAFEGKTINKSSTIHAHWRNVSPCSAPSTPTSRLAHKPQDIWDEVARLANLPLSLRNIYFARRIFVAVYKHWNGRNTHDDIRQLLDSGELHLAMTALDFHFFGRALTGTTQTRNWPALAELHVEGNIFAEGHIGHAVRSESAAHALVHPSEHGKSTIYIDAFHLDGSPQTPKELLEILVHEMAHAAYDSFACRCKSCNDSDPEVLGGYGHGRLWVKLVEHMRDTIRSWDKALEDFYTEDLEWMHNWEP